MKRFETNRQRHPCTSRSSPPTALSPGRAQPGDSEPLTRGGGLIRSWARSGGSSRLTPSPSGGEDFSLALRVGALALEVRLGSGTLKRRRHSLLHPRQIALLRKLLLPQAAMQIKSEWHFVDVLLDPIGKLPIRRRR